MEQWLGVLRMLRTCCGAVARCASYVEDVLWSSGSVCFVC